MKAALVVGGFGTRIQATLGETPKVLAPIDGTPFLEYTVRWLKKQGVSEIVFCTGHKKERIVDHFGNGEKLGVNIVYSPEYDPLGTGGALANARRYLDGDTFIFMNGDCLADCNLAAAIQKHKESKASATIHLTPANNAQHQELIKFEQNSWGGLSTVQAILQRGTEEHQSFLINNNAPQCNSGIFIFEPEVFNHMPSTGKFTLEPTLFPSLLQTNKKICSFKENGVYIEIGNPQLYAGIHQGPQLAFLQSIKKRGEKKMTNIPLRSVIETMHKNDMDFTLVGIGPMSELIVESTLELGKELDFPIMFIASRSQIDADELGGGYVNNWNQARFKAFVDEKKEKIGFHGLLYLCRDHGGPWQRSNEKHLPYEEAMEKAKFSYMADITNGFNFIHLDPTLDPSMNNSLPLELVGKRTIELLTFLETKRKELGLPEISYEFGTDETSGDLTSFDGFEEFTRSMVLRCKELNLPMPAFMVGQTGTLVKMKRNVGRFDLQTAKRLNDITKKYSVGFKEHNGDYVPIEDLRLHPEHRITATNVAPEFGVVETTALVKLTAKEEIAHKMGQDFMPSNFFKVISEEVIVSGKWKKWLTVQERNLTTEQVRRDPEKKLEVTLVAGHYTFANPRVREAREKLYNNLKELKIYADPEKEVKKAVKKSIRKYVENFNLVSSTSKILRNIERKREIEMIGEQR